MSTPCSPRLHSSPSSGVGRPSVLTLALATACASGGSDDGATTPWSSETGGGASSGREETTGGADSGSSGTGTSSADSGTSAPTSSSSDTSGTGTTTTGTGTSSAESGTSAGDSSSSSSGSEESGSGGGSTGGDETGSPTLPPDYYVSPTGDNGDGRSWETAWNELDQVRWDQLGPGDVVWIDGGSDEIVYHSTLEITGAGADGMPITLQLASEPGRNGRAVIDGGLTDWPECQPGSAGDDPPSAPGGNGTRSVGIAVSGAAWVVVDGMKWGGIEIRNHTRSGVDFSDDAEHVALRHLEIHNNTYADDDNGEGVALAGSYVELSYLDVHHNGQDAIQQEGPADHVNLGYSHIHDHFCSHPDGIQAYAGGMNQVYEIHHNVFDTIDLQAVFLGENDTHDTWIVGAEIHDNVFFGGRYGVKSKNEKSTDWEVHHNTFVDMSNFAVEWCCGGATAPMSIHHNVFANTGGFYLGTAGGQTDFSDNCLWETDDASGVAGSNNVEQEPVFVDAAGEDFELTPSSGCQGKGAEIGSVDDLR